MAIHSSDAKMKLAEYHIGTLSGGNIANPAEPATKSDDDGHFLHAKRWKPTSLVEVQNVSRDSRIFRFLLDRPDQLLGLPTGQHVYVRLRRKAGPNVVEGEVVQRAYTPLSRPECTGFIDLLVKYVDDAFSSVSSINLQCFALGFIIPTISIHWEDG